MPRIVPNGCAHLEHRALYLCGTPGRQEVVAASGNGMASFVDLFSGEVRLQRVANSLQAVVAHPTKQIFAFADGDTGDLVIHSHSETPVARLAAPDVAAESSNWVPRGFQHCLFDDEGRLLWLVASLSDTAFEVSLVETQEWSTVQRMRLDDDFGASAFMFAATGRKELTALWVAAGQDGQETHWLIRRGAEFHCAKVDELSNCLPPAFSEDGSQLLVIEEGNSLRRYAYPDMKQLGAPISLNAEDDSFGTSLCYCDGQHAMAGSNNGRLLLIDAEQMRIEEEITVAGIEHDPIAGDASASADDFTARISWFTKFGDTIVFVVDRERSGELDAWKDTLLWYRS